MSLKTQDLTHVDTMGTSTDSRTGGMNQQAATIQYFRDIAAAMQTEPTNWQWVGPHVSQRMFGITKTRAEAYAKRHGGVAKQLDGAA